MRVLFCWELGGGLGHITSILPIARKFVEEDHTVALAVKDLSKIYPFTNAHDDQLIWLQAPLWLPKLSISEGPLSYSEILFHSGFLDADRLTGLVTGWRSIISNYKPDLMIFNHSPVAVLASHGLNITRVSYGHGFFVPPDNSPLPPIKPAGSASLKRLVNSDHRVLKTINRILQSFDTPPIEKVYELFDLDKHFLKCFEEIDNYTARTNQNITYIGPCTSSSAGSAPVWPEGKNKRIFAYLKPEYSQIEAVIEQLIQTDYNILIFCKGLPQQLKEKLKSTTITLTESPVNFAQALQEADLVINHAGIGTVLSTSLKQRPQLTLPIYTEQLLTAQMIAKQGGSLFLSASEVEAKFTDTLNKLIVINYSDAVNPVFAKKLAEHDIERAIDKIHLSCLKLVEQKQHSLNNY